MTRTPFLLILIALLARVPSLAAEPLSFASQQSSADVDFRWSGDALLVAVGVSGEINDVSIDIPNAACNVQGRNRIACYIDMMGLDLGRYNAKLTIVDLAGDTTQAYVAWDWKGNPDDYVASVGGMHFGDNGSGTRGQGAAFCPGPDQTVWVTATAEHQQSGNRLPVAELMARVHFFYDEANNQVSLGNVATTRGTALASGFRLVDEKVGGPQSVWVPAEANAWAKAQLEAWGSASITLNGTKVSTEMILFSRTIVIDFMLYSDGTCDVIGYPSSKRGVKKPERHLA